MEIPLIMDPRRWTMVRRSIYIYGPFCASVVPIKAQLFGTSDLRKGSMDRSTSGSTTGSSSPGQATPSDEATSSGKVPVPRNYDPELVAKEPNRWCFEGKWQIYRDARMWNGKEKMARLITEERRVFTGRKWYESCIPPMLPLSEVQITRGPSPQPRTLSLLLWSEVFRWTCHIPPSVDSFTALARITLGHSTLWLARYIAVDGERVVWVAAPHLAMHGLWSTNDKLIQASQTLDISLIRDEANVAAPRRGPQIAVPPLGADLVDDVEKMQGDDLATSAHTDDAPASSSQDASQAPSSSRATLFSGASVVQLARVQKLEA
uniref:Integrase core domain containing protein n=1 Tax=Solanum tuberosum TaxID=4113 RepID=M1DU82_SOLTU